MTLKFGMRNNILAQSQMDIQRPRRHMLEYTPMIFCGLLNNSDPNRILVLGLGGGVIPREMRHYYPDADIDVVEIDGEILNVAKEYFIFKEDPFVKNKD